MRLYIGCLSVREEGWGGGFEIGQQGLGGVRRRMRGNVTVILTFFFKHCSEFRFGDVPRIAHFVGVEVERDVFCRKEDMVD